MTTQNARRFQLLEPMYHKMEITSVREFKGSSIDDETRQRTRLLDVIFKDIETGVEVHNNYSLDKPNYLLGVLTAVCGGDEEAAADLLGMIDWQDANDVQQVFGKAVDVKIYHEEYPVGSDLMRNKVGNVKAVEVTIRNED